MSQVISMIEPTEFFSVCKPGRVKGCGASKELTEPHCRTACSLQPAGCVGVWVWEGKVLALVLTGGSLES